MLNVRCWCRAGRRCRWASGSGAWARTGHPGNRVSCWGSLGCSLRLDLRRNGARRAARAVRWRWSGVSSGQDRSRCTDGALVSCIVTRLCLGASRGIDGLCSRVTCSLLCANGNVRARENTEYIGIETHHREARPELERRIHQPVLAPMANDRRIRREARYDGIDRTIHSLAA
jgi:hypothetical protein